MCRTSGEDEEDGLGDVIGLGGVRQLAAGGGVDGRCVAEDQLREGVGVSGGGEDV